MSWNKRCDTAGGVKQPMISITEVTLETDGLPHKHAVMLMLAYHTKPLSEATLWRTVKANNARRNEGYIGNTASSWTSPKRVSNLSLFMVLSAVEL